MDMALGAVNAQVKLTITTCYELAEQNYPLVKQRELIAKSREFSIENVARGYWPQVSIQGQATYQSDVTQVPIKIPGNDIPTISKDQYKIYGEVTQTVVDGGTIRAQKQTVETNALLEEEKLGVELYKLRERINQLFFGVLLVTEQLNQTDLMQKDLYLGISRTNAAIANGIALKSNADVLQAELLKADQRSIELKSARKAFIDMLSLFISQPLDDSVLFERPQPVVLSSDITRVELLVFEHQYKLLEVQRDLIHSRTRPRLSLFVQGGYGRPALNFLNNDFTSYYIGGLRLSWFLSGFYTRNNEKSVVEINRNSLMAQKETFLFNTTLALKQQNAEVNKWQDLIRTDGEIIVLRGRIKAAALAQLENGVINANDYLREVNAEDLSKQNKLAHEIQLLMAQYNHKTISGNK
jgi:outer membrane protein TolC